MFTPNAGAPQAARPKRINWCCRSWRCRRGGWSPLPPPASASSPRGRPRAAVALWFGGADGSGHGVGVVAPPCASARRCVCSLMARGGRGAGPAARAAGAIQCVRNWPRRGRVRLRLVVLWGAVAAAPWGVRRLPRPQTGLPHSVRGRFVGHLAFRLAAAQSICCQGAMPYLRGHTARMPLAPRGPSPFFGVRGGWRSFISLGVGVGRF